MSKDIFGFLKPSAPEPEKPATLPKQSAKLDPFAFVATINKKSELIHEDDAKFYDAWTVNRCFSNTFDTVLFANEMNQLAHADKLMQYHFYYFGVDKKPNRYGQWNKASKDADVAVVMEYYGYSRARATEVLDIVGPRLSELKQALQKGGRKPT